MVNELNGNYVVATIWLMQLVLVPNYTAERPPKCMQIFQACYFIKQKKSIFAFRRSSTGRTLGGFVKRIHDSSSARNLVSTKRSRKLKRKYQNVTNTESIKLYMYVYENLRNMENQRHDFKGKNVYYLSWRVAAARLYGLAIRNTRRVHRPTKMHTNFKSDSNLE